MSRHLGGGRNGVKGWPLLTCFVGLWLAAGADAGPLKGTVSTRQRIEAGKNLRFEMRFKANERACVILIGDHRPVVSLAIFVRDAKGKLVAQDDPGGDFCAAIWYPAREGTYIVELVNRGDVYNNCYLAVK